MNEEPSSIRLNAKLPASLKVGVPNTSSQTFIYGSLAWLLWTRETPNRPRVVVYLLLYQSLSQNR